MNSAEVLPPEDRAEFERVLDEALRTARLTAGADRFPVEELRTLATRELPRIAAAAEAEYRRFAQLRHELRRPGRPAAAAPSSLASSGDGSGNRDRSGNGNGNGSGLVAVVAALVPVLAAIAAVIFLLLGYALGLADPEPAMAKPMREVGWIFVVLAAIGLLLAVAGLMIAAIHNGSQTSIHARPAGGTGPLAQEVARAREEWRRALLDHGIMPFLREHAGRPGGDDHERRTPRLRFSSPDFSSPDFDSNTSSQGGSRSRPRYSQPDYAGPRFGSPDFTSPEEGRDEEDRAATRAGRGFAPPDYAGPDFDSPDFDSPAAGRDESTAARRGFAAPDFSSPDFDSPDFDSGADDQDAEYDEYDEPRPRPRYGQPDFSSPEFTSPADGGTDRD
jgi:hypothetical protein